MNPDFKYEQVGYNGPHLANLDFEAFKKEVAHHFTGDKVDERIKGLYDAIQAKYKPTDDSKRSFGFEQAARVEALKKVPGDKPKTAEEEPAKAVQVATPAAKPGDQVTAVTK